MCVARAMAAARTASRRARARGRRGPHAARHAGAGASARRAERGARARAFRGLGSPAGGAGAAAGSRFGRGRSPRLVSGRANMAGADAKGAKQAKAAPASAGPVAQATKSVRHTCALIGRVAARDDAWNKNDLLDAVYWSRQLLSAVLGERGAALRRCSVRRGAARRRGRFACCMRSRAHALEQRPDRRDATVTIGADDRSFSTSLSRFALRVSARGARPPHRVCLPACPPACLPACARA